LKLQLLKCFLSKSFDVKLGYKMERLRLNSAVTLFFSINLGTYLLMLVLTKKVFLHEVP
jgi:hypothetical protein